MVRFAFLLSLCITFISSGANAETIRNFRVAGWLAGAYTATGTRDFSHCAATARYGSGVSVSFSINKNFNWSMGFSNPAWQLNRGHSFDIAFTVDDMSPLTAKAVAITHNMVEVYLADSRELFSRFQRGYVLRVAGANQVFNFNLTGTSQLLPALLSCAENRGMTPRVASNPFEKKEAPKSAESSGDRANSTAEALTLAANLLSLSGAQGFHLLAPTDMPEIKGHARWVDGNTFGTIHVLPTASATDLKNLSGYLIGEDAKTCKGAYFSGALPDEDKAIVTRVFTTCQADNDKPFTTYYLAMPRKAGGAYVISTIAIGAEQPAKEKDSLLRAAVFKLSK